MYVSRSDHEFLTDRNLIELRPVHLPAGDMRQVFDVAILEIFSDRVTVCTRKRNIMEDLSKVRKGRLILETLGETSTS